MSKATVVFGFHAVTARLRHRAQAVREILVDSQRHDSRMRRLVDAAVAAGVSVQPVQGRRLDDIAAGGRHQGVVAFVEPTETGHTLQSVIDAAVGRALLLVLDGVQDPYNLGACLRVADALGAHAVVAPRDRAVGITPTVEKVASGAVQSMPYIMVPNLARALREMQEANLWVVGASPISGTPLHAYDMTRATALVLGAEGEGLRRLTAETCDELLAIPMTGTVESLNVAVAAGICLYEAQRQRRAPATPPMTR
jgi:23S rRNA (guanosine2251-2'-O)-methyltransferase